MAYVGTYPPKECGIATFTLDAANATDICGWKSIVFAVDDAVLDSAHPDSKVVFTIEKENRASYTDAARKLRRMNVSVLSIQHEYGIYGGDHGEYLSARLGTPGALPGGRDSAHHPPEPIGGAKNASYSNSKSTARFSLRWRMRESSSLVSSYGVARHKIAYVPHGAPIFPSSGGAEALKERHRAGGPNGAFNVRLDQPQQRNRRCDRRDAAHCRRASRSRCDMVLGATHPVIKKREGEWYREQLVQRGLGPGA